MSLALRLHVGCRCRKQYNVHREQYKRVVPVKVFNAGILGLGPLKISQHCSFFLFNHDYNNSNSWYVIHQSTSQHYHRISCELHCKVLRWVFLKQKCSSRWKFDLWCNVIGRLLHTKFGHFGQGIAPLVKDHCFSHHVWVQVLIFGYLPSTDIST